MNARLAPVALAVVAALASAPAAGQQAPEGQSAVPAMPEPALKPAPQLVPPPPANVPRGPGATPAGAPFQPGVIFLRADRVEGAAERYVEASGKVELRTRSETVLADWLRYDFVADEVWGKGDVLIRRGIDWITGPELRFKRDTETGTFSSPRFFIGENGSRGSAAEIRFTGPNQYEASDARYTTCVAPRDDWYIRMDELEVDRSRMIGTGHDATVYFLGAPII
jgi:LPS-assembly protein